MRHTFIVLPEEYYPISEMMIHQLSQVEDENRYFLIDYDEVIFYCYADVEKQSFTFGVHEDQNHLVNGSEADLIVFMLYVMRLAEEQEIFLFSDIDIDSVSVHFGLGYDHKTPETFPQILRHLIDDEFGIYVHYKLVG